MRTYDFLWSVWSIFCGRSFFNTQKVRCSARVVWKRQKKNRVVRCHSTPWAIKALYALFLYLWLLSRLKMHCLYFHLYPHGKPRHIQFKSYPQVSQILPSCTSPGVRPDISWIHSHHPISKDAVSIYCTVQYITTIPHLPKSSNFGQLFTETVKVIEMI
jgi:hypothetical protein